jgi:hypothetical protein
MFLQITVNQPMSSSPFKPLSLLQSSEPTFKGGIKGGLRQNIYGQTNFDVDLLVVKKCLRTTLCPFSKTNEINILLNLLPFQLL